MVVVAAEAIMTIAKVAVLVLVKTLVLEVVTAVTVEMLTMAEVIVVLEVVVGAGCGGENSRCWEHSGRDGCHGADRSGRGCVGLFIPMLSTVW